MTRLPEFSFSVKNDSTEKKHILIFYKYQKNIYKIFKIKGCNIIRDILLSLYFIVYKIKDKKCKSDLRKLLNINYYLLQIIAVKFNFNEYCKNY